MSTLMLVTRVQQFKIVVNDVLVGAEEKEIQQHVERALSTDCAQLLHTHFMNVVVVPESAVQ